MDWKCVVFDLNKKRYLLLLSQVWKRLGKYGKKFPKNSPCRKLSGNYILYEKLRIFLNYKTKEKSITIILLQYYVPNKTVMNSFYTKFYDRK